MCLKKSKVQNVAIQCLIGEASLILSVISGGQALWEFNRELNAAILWIGTGMGPIPCVFVWKRKAMVED